MTTDFLIVGLNHNTAPVDLRERVAFGPDQLEAALPKARDVSGLAEVAILSTCNRTELYAIGTGSETRNLTDWLCAYHALPKSDLLRSIYEHHGRAAIAHLMRVAAGLDSMILGEPQIFGQLKDAFAIAQNHGTVGPGLHRLSQSTFRTVKKVRTDTAIGENPVSVASTGVTLAGQLFDDVAGCRALLIGAGETIELVARHLINAGLTEIVVCNRTLGNATALVARLARNGVNVIAAALSDIPDYLEQADIVIASTGSDLPIVGKGTVERVLKIRRHRPIFMLDLAVPRDIEPEVQVLPDVYLYTVDDLQEIMSENLAGRRTAAREAEVMIELAVDGFLRDQEERNNVDALVAYRSAHHRLRDEVLARAQQRIERGDDPRDVLDQLANQLINRVMHLPMMAIKNASAADDQQQLANIRSIFKLDDTK